MSVHFLWRKEPKLILNSFTCILGVFIFFIGLCLGSFLTAFSYRLARGENFWTDRSRCPKCKNIIAWYDNIPLLSYMLLQGKCRNCGYKISLRYPLIELSTAMIFLFVFTFKGLPLQGVYSTLNLVYLLFISIFLIAIFIIDFEYQIIPDELVFILLSLAFFANLDDGQIFSHILAGFSVSLFLLLLNFVT